MIHHPEVMKAARDLIDAKLEKCDEAAKLGFYRIFPKYPDGIPDKSVEEVLHLLDRTLAKRSHAQSVHQEPKA